MHRNLKKRGTVKGTYMPRPSPQTEGFLPESWFGACAVAACSDAITARLREAHPNHDFEVDRYAFLHSAVGRGVLIERGSSPYWVGKLASCSGIPLTGNIPRVDGLQLNPDCPAYAQGTHVESYKATSLPPCRGATPNECNDAMMYREHLCDCLDEGPVIASLYLQKHWVAPRAENEPYRPLPGKEHYLTRQLSNGKEVTVGHCVAIYGYECPEGDVRSLILYYQDNMIGTPGRHCMSPDAVDAYYVPIINNFTITQNPMPGNELTEELRVAQVALKSTFFDGDKIMHEAWDLFSLLTLSNKVPSLTNCHASVAIEIDLKDLDFKLCYYGAQGQTTAKVCACPLLKDKIVKADALSVQKVATIFSDGASKKEYKLTEDITNAGFSINPDELESITSKPDMKAFKMHCGVDGISKKICSTFDRGISTSDLDKRKRIYGENHHAEKPARSFWMFVWDALQDMTLIILMVCAVLSAVVCLASKGLGMYESLGIILSILLVVMVTAISDYRQSLQFKELVNEQKKIFILVTRDGSRQKIPIYDLVVGDIVHISIGDQVPADGLFIHGYSLLLDVSSLSGETDPVYISEDKPFILAGTKVQDGSAKMMVTAVGMRTEWGRLMSAFSEGGEDEASFAMKQLMKDKAPVRHLSACETMGSAGTICTDKTGTLTINHMVVDKIWISQVSKSLGSNNSLDDLSSAIPSTTLNLLLQSILENTSAEVVKGKDGKQTVLGTPTERAILEFGLMLEGHDDEDRTCTKVKVEPFNSVKKKMAVLVSLPNGTYRWFSKGASEIVLQMCDKIVDGDENSVPLSEAQRKNVLDTINSFTCDALRTLCLAYKEVNDFDDEAESPTSGFTLICIFGIKDPVRPGVKDAVKACISAGITVRMVTGDNVNTAKAIAKECGILTDDGIAIEEPEFRYKSPEEMRDLIPKIQVMARSLPLDKHTLVTKLRGMSREVVAVPGDGTNDAPALHESDIGLAMGIAGTEVAKESADVIVLDDNFSTSVARWGRPVYINIQKFVQFQLTINVVALVINFVAACITGSAPLTTVQLLWVNMIMDTLGALVLATEPPNDDMFKRPPVGRGESFITKVMWRNIIGQSLYQLVVLGVLMFGGERILNIKGADSKSVINKLYSTPFCSAREMQKINWICFGIIAVTVTLQVVIIEFIGTLASTIRLDWQLWLVSIDLGSISLIVGIILRCIPKSGQTSASPNC